MQRSRAGCGGSVLLLAVWTTVSLCHAQTTVRVATWNIETIGARGSSQYTAELAVLNRLCPDVVGINEIDGNAEIDDFHNLAADAGFSFTLVPDTNPFGTLRNGVMSKLPFLSQTIHTSAALSGDSNANDLTRLILEVVVDVPDSAVDLTLLSEHWKSGTTDNDEFRRVVESIRMTQAIPDLDRGLDAYVFMGDVNEEIAEVPRSPNPFTAVPNGMPNGWRLGSDLQSMLNGPGLQNDPFAYLTDVQGPALNPLDARQKDGSRTTRDSSGRRIDYILVSGLLATFNPPSEVYDSRDEGLSGGLTKCGSRLSSTTSAAASDHFPVFADLTVPAGGGGAYGDGDLDGDVDLRDAAEFMNCFTGAGGSADAGCRKFDNNGDNDVDRADYHAFWLAMTGP